MRQTDKVRVIQKMIKPYGFTVENGDHRRIINTAGKAVYWFPGSPSCPYFAENVIRDLVRMGLVPHHLKRQKIR